MSHKRYQNPRKGYSRADRRQMRASIAFEQDLWFEDEFASVEVETAAEPDVGTLMAAEPGESVEVEARAEPNVGTLMATGPGESVEVETPAEPDVGTLMATGSGESVEVEQMATSTDPVDEPDVMSSAEAARFRRVDRLIASICRAG